MFTVPPSGKPRRGSCVRMLHCCNDVIKHKTVSKGTGVLRELFVQPYKEEKNEKNPLTLFLKCGIMSKSPNERGADSVLKKSASDLEN